MEKQLYESVKSDLLTQRSRVAQSYAACSVAAPCVVTSAAVKLSIGSTTRCTITEKAPTRAFSWLKAATTAFTFKTLLRH